MGCSASCTLRQQTNDGDPLTFPFDSHVAPLLITRVRNQTQSCTRTMPTGRASARVRARQIKQQAHPQRAPRNLSTQSPGDRPQDGRNHVSKVEKNNSASPVVERVHFKLPIPWCPRSELSLTIGTSA